MITFEVNDMTCGHCVEHDHQSVEGQWTRRRLSEIDLASHRVEVESAKADTDEIRDAISEAGVYAASRRAARVIPAERQGR